MAPACCSICTFWPYCTTFPTTLFEPVDWPWFTNISHAIILATTQSWSYHTVKLLVGHYEGTNGCTVLLQQQVVQSCGTGIHHLGIHHTADGGHIRLCFEHDSSYRDEPDVQWLLPHGMLSRGTLTSEALCILGKDVSNVKQQEGNCRIHAAPE